jgi:hypothetical protein
MGRVDLDEMPKVKYEKPVLTDYGSIADHTFGFAKAPGGPVHPYAPSI